MIPKAGIEIMAGAVKTTDTSKTYHISGYKIQGYLDGSDALQQAIEKLLKTEKYEYPIYSFSYGIELENLIGKDKFYVQMELGRRIKECLLEDERITSVENFQFSMTKETIQCAFDVKSIYGKHSFYKEVAI